MKILILVLILLSGGFAGEEIGRPFISDNKGKVNSMVISKDGEHIYTLKGNLISEYSLSPVKKAGSFKVVLHHPEKISNKYKGYQITISNDSKRVILYSANEIQLWDIEDEKLLKTVKVSLRLGTMSKYGFLVISQGSENILSIYNDSNLSLVKQVHIPYKYPYETGIEGYGETPLSMYPDKNLLFVRYLINGIVFNLDTFKIEEIIELNKESVKELKVKYHGYFKSYIWRKFMLNYSIGFLTQSSYVFKDEYQIKELVSYRLRDSSDCEYKIAKLTVTKSRKKRKLFYLYQFKDAWIVMERPSSGSHSPGLQFTCSGDMKKYLKMKTQDGKVIPINDATFEKYNTKIKLHPCE